MNTWTFIVGAAAALLGALGLGGGSLLLLYLTLFAGLEQLQSQGINLLFFLACSAVSVAVYLKDKLIDAKALLLAAAGGLAGVLLGWFLSGSVDEKLLSKAFALLLLYIGARELFGKGDSDQKAAKNADGRQDDKKDAVGRQMRITDIVPPQSRHDDAAGEGNKSGK